MKFIKYFEFGPPPSYLFRCDEFQIKGELEGSRIYNSPISSKHSIFALIDLVRDNSKYLNNKKLREIPINLKERYIVDDFMKLSPEKIKNIEKYRSGEVGDFISDDRDELKTIPSEAYMKLTFKYYPIIVDIIKKSKTYGDLIDEFKIIHKNILKDLEWELTINKYNL